MTKFSNIVKNLADEICQSSKLWTPSAKRIYSKILKKLGYQFQNLAHFFQTEKRYKYILGFFIIKPPRFWKQGFENIGGSPSRIFY